MTDTTPTTVAELRAQIAEGCRQAATVYRGNAHLRGADQIAERLEADARRNDTLAHD